MSRSVGEAGHVYAVEPSPEIRERLLANLELNRIANVTVVPYGISDRSERRMFTLSKANHGASHFDAPSEDGLELRRLSEVIPEAELTRVSLIKIDVEGMELQVMRDILKLLPRLPPDVTITAELRIDDTLKALLAQFRLLGFRTMLLKNDYKMWRYSRGEVSDPEPVEQQLPVGQHDVALVRGG